MIGCTSLGLLHGNSSDRICGACRFGFEKVKDTCVSILLRDIALENITNGNAGAFTELVATFVQSTNQSSTDFSSLVQLTKKVSEVCIRVYIPEILLI